MNNYLQFPHVRVEPAAHQHLGRIIQAFKNAGRNITMARFVSDLILAQPVPDGAGPAAVAQPGPGQEKA